MVKGLDLLQLRIDDFGDGEAKETMLSYIKTFAVKAQDFQASSGNEENSRRGFRPILERSGPSLFCVTIVS